MTHELTVEWSDGRRYVMAEGRDRRDLDREALHWLPRRGVVAVSVTPRPERSGGYRRTK